MHGRRSRTSFVNSWFLKECLVWLYRVFLAFVEDGFDILFDSAFSGCLRQSFLEHFDLLIPKVCIVNDMSRWLRPITRTARMKANQWIWICIIPYVPFCQLVLVNIWVFLNFYSAIIVSLIDSAFSGCRIETWKQFVFSWLQLHSCWSISPFCCIKWLIFWMLEPLTRVCHLVQVNARQACWTFCCFTSSFTLYLT